MTVIKCKECGWRTDNPDVREVYDCPLCGGSLESESDKEGDGAGA